MSQPPPCRNWAATGSCQFGARCRFSHGDAAGVASAGAWCVAAKGADAFSFACRRRRCSIQWQRAAAHCVPQLGCDGHLQIRPELYDCLLFL